MQTASLHAAVTAAMADTGRLSTQQQRWHCALAAPVIAGLQSESSGGMGVACLPQVLGRGLCQVMDPSGSMIPAWLQRVGLLLVHARLRPAEGPTTAAVAAVAVAAAEEAAVACRIVCWPLTTQEQGLGQLTQRVWVQAKQGARLLMQQLQVPLVQQLHVYRLQQQQQHRRRRHCK